MTIPKTVFGLSAGVVLLALTGCGSKPDAWCTVTDDLRAIAEAREMADRVQEQEIATLLAHLADPLLDIDAFAVLRGAQDIPWLTSLLASEVSDYTKCRVMLALDRGDGGQGGRLLAALHDPKLRSYAAGVLSEMAKDTQDGTVDEDLNRAMREGKEFEQKVLESM